MIGNDVVDLILAKKESNWKRKGYLDKLFSNTDQDFIKNANNQDEMVWMLWSIKESTYKAYQRICYNQGFYPLKIKIESLNLIEAIYFSKVKLFEINFYGKTIIENEIVKTVVVKNENDFANLVSCNSAEYQKNSNGLPFEVHSKKPISISHHGRSREVLFLK